jgi:multidrug efflux pump subunit AcrA (membrane-fusion protein)
VQRAHRASTLGSWKLPVLVAAICLWTQGAGAQQATAGKAHEFKGKVIAAQEAEIAARIDGRLAKINFTAGQIVKKGDLLFEFDQKFRQISLAGAQAKQKVLEAQLQLADVKLKNAQTLRTRNVSSEMQLLEAQAQRDIAAANVDEAKTTGACPAWGGSTAVTGPCMKT